MNVPLLVAKAAFVVVAVPFLLYQVRKPSRWIGGRFLRAMNVAHSALTDWGLGHVRIEPNHVILDVGCGGGRTVAKLATRAPDGKVHGIDYSSESVAVSRRENARAIGEGRVEIGQASVSRLPFPEGHFDLVTAVETQYYWPAPLDDMKEIRRVLKPGGRAVVILETYKGGRFGAVKGAVMKALRSKHLSLDQHRALLAGAGFSEIEIFTEPRRGWFCGVGKKSV
jgi:ubiquinone/menaquinone biosynthesis C-methylase UbiE